MKKNYSKVMSKTMIMSLILTASLPTSLAKAAAGQVTRVGEGDRYATAAKVATTNWSSAKDVVLVCGEGYADAVSASVLAKQLNAPILLTTAKSLNSSAKAALEALTPQNIYIVGGDASVSQAVRNQLKNSNYNLIELTGKNRYETNLAVANQLVKLGVKADNVILVSGEGFSDALSIAPVAAAKGQILLLGNNNEATMNPVINFVNANNSKVTVVGTTNVINDDIFKALGAVERVNGGATRFETNMNVLNRFSSDLKANKLFVANASGDGYADALVASSLAGKTTSPLVLVDDETSTATNKAVDYIKGKATKTTDLNVIGGSGVVSDNVISKINSTVSGSTPSTSNPTVQSVSTNGLNQIKVVFNTEVDKDSAELVRNYEINGANLGSAPDTKSSATLQDDKRTVLITFSNPFQQYKTVNFAVKNTLLDKNSNSITRFEQKLTFSALTPPTIESVTAKGGNKLIVKFSEPIRISSSDLSLLKINRRSLTNFGLNESMTVFGEKSDSWSDKLELYFNSPLPVGNNTFSIPNGENGIRFDNAAGFYLKQSSVNFTVDSVDGTPQVKSITCDNSNTIYITYDRPMDKQTALEDSNYKLNDSTISVDSSDISFDEGSNDMVVKIKDVHYLLKDGDNQLTVENNIKDTYGNEIKETNLSFYVADDTSKPQISAVNIIDNKTIRIKFNKSVITSYATNKSNYKLVDSSGADITYKIDNILGVYDSSNNNNQIFDIKFSATNALRGSRYTFTAKNIIDTNSTPNVMDTYTTVITGTDDESPSVTAIVKKSDDAQGVVVFFNKSMDESSITSLENYFYVDGTNRTLKLPSASSISPGIDNKSVIIDFPSNYTIGNGLSENDVAKIGVSNVKDTNGMLLDTVAYSDSISTNYSNGPSLIDNTASLTFDGNDIKVKISLTDPLDILEPNDFRVNGKTPDSGMTIGNDVILIFKAGIDNNSKIDSIKSCGSSTTLSIYNPSSVDIAGRKLKSDSVQVFIPPRTMSELWTSNYNSGNNSTVTLVFNQNIDDDIKTSYNDDFIFTNERTGENLNVLSVDVNGSNVVYKFNYGSIKTGDHIDVRATNISSNINIRSTELNNGNYTIYTPTKDDLSNRVIIAH